MGYIILDGEYYGIEGYDENNPILGGMAFEELLDLCGKYSYCFSLLFKSDNADNYPELDKNLIGKFLIHGDAFLGGDIFRNGFVKFYKYCEESKQALLNISKNIFYFYCLEDSNPDSLTFYRIDRSMFLTTIPHHGECYLFPNDAEDISDFLNKFDSQCYKYTDLKFEGNFIQKIKL